MGMEEVEENVGRGKFWGVDGEEGTRKRQVAEKREGELEKSENIDKVIRGRNNLNDDSEKSEKYWTEINLKRNEIIYTYIYIYIYIYIYMHIYIYIYMYRERERERERWLYHHIMF